MSFSFGTPSSAPATTGITGGFSFGANKPATPGFGLTATSQPSTGLFGTPTTTAPSFGASTAFGATGTPAFGASTGTPAFGATSAAPTFGASATPAFGTSAPTFGATSAAPTFGGTSAAPTFGAATTPAFGATSTAPAFGVTTTPAFGGTSTAFGAGTGLGTGINFGAGTNTSTAATGLTLGAPAASTGLGGLGGFGSTATTQAGLGGGLFGATSTAAQSTGLFELTLDAPAVSTGCWYGRRAMIEVGLRGGLFGATSTTAQSIGLFGAKLGTTFTSGAPLTSAAPSIGLGGVAPSGNGTNTTASGSGKSEPPKQAKLPNEIQTTVDSFKEFVKKQKSLSSEVMRVSIKPLHKVAKDAEATLRLALSLSGEVSKARAHSRRLRSAAATALANAESISVSPGMELEGSGPPAYVKDLITELEHQLLTFRRQMDVADRQMQASPKLLTEQELTLGIRRMHESLVALAGRLQAVHTLVEAQKEQYLNLRKYVLKDPTNVFETPSTYSSLDQILFDAEASRKKNKSSTFNPASAVLADPKAALGSLQQLAGPAPFTYIGTTLSPYPMAESSGSSWQPQPVATTTASCNVSFGTTPSADANTFQLQKPPGKRGKQ